MTNTLMFVFAALAGLLVVVCCLAWFSLRKKENPIASCGILLLIAGFCAYGYLASGEYDGRKELMWKSGYAIAGTVSLVCIALLVAKSRAK